MEHATNADTRKRFYKAFTNRAYPANVDLLNQIIKKRDELAHLLGFDSYASLNIDSQMAKTPEKAEAFLNDVFKKASIKETEEYKRLISDLPESVTLANDKKIHPWDKAFLQEYYKKKYYNVDNREIAQYFPMEQTIDRLMNVYKQFFNIELSTQPITGLWHEDVTLMQVRRKSDNVLLGNIILDLYPRENKYGHACQITVIPSMTLPDGSIQPALAIVVANFAKSTETKPSLLELHDVRTFFHEFGHAIHTVLGATDLATTSGTSVKTDFVEMPSQMLEEWLWDPEILKMMSAHYKTGEPLSDDYIKRIMSLKNLTVGFFLNRQIFYALLSLHLFGSGQEKDSNQVARDLYKKTRVYDEFDLDNHDQASFGHLMGYGARYYGYLWCKYLRLIYSILLNNSDY